MQPLPSEEDAGPPEVGDATENRSVGGWPDERATEQVCHSLFENPASFLSSPCLVKGGASIAAVWRSITRKQGAAKLYFFQGGAGADEEAGGGGRGGGAAGEHRQTETTAAFL